MQRIAALTGACTALVLLLGCQDSRSIAFGPPPEPLLHTTPWDAGPRPPRVPLDPPPSREPRVRLDTRGLLPPKGVRRDKWQVIVVHHSAAENATPAGMHEWHLNGRHWENGLGYHFVIGNGVNYPDGQIFVGPRWKRQIHGAHCAASAGQYFGQYRPDNFFNNHGVGICLIGNFEKERPTPRQLAVLEELITFLCAEMNIPASRVYGHGEVTHRTQCPGRLLNLRALRRDLAARFKREGLAQTAPHSGTNRQLAAALNGDADRAPLAAHALVEIGQALYRLARDRYDDIAHAQPVASRRPGRDIEDYDAALEAALLAKRPRLASISQAQPAP